MKKLILNTSLLLFAVGLPLSLKGTTVSWTGGSGDWDEPTNWSTGSVPGSADDVVISSGPGITITHASNIVDVVLNIQCDQALVISNGSITVSSGASQFGDSFTITNGATLGAAGVGTTLLCSGAVDADDGNFHVSGGAVMTFPTLTSYYKYCSGGIWTVTGTNSVLDLPALTNMTGYACSSPIIEAESGGQILATNLVSIAMGPQGFSADGSNSLINLSGLKTVSGQNSYFVAFEASGGGTLLITNIVNANLMSVTLTGGTLNLPGVTNFADGNVTLNSGGQLALAGLKNYTKTCYGAYWDVTGSNSILTLPALTNITAEACSYPAIEAEAGGQIIASNLVTVLAGPLNFQADGSNSVINLKALTNCSGQGGYYVEFEASAGGSLEISNLQGGPFLNFTLSGVTLSLPVFSNFPDGNFTLNDAAVLTLPALRSYSKTCYGAYWTVTGTNTELDLPALTNFIGNACNYPVIQAESGGQILMADLYNILAGPLTFQADGTNSYIDLAGLTNCSGQDGYNVTFEASAGGTVQIPHLTNGPQVGVTLNPGGSIPVAQLRSLAAVTANGADASFSSLTNFYDGNFTISGGADVTIPALASYGKNCTGGAWTVTGSNSVLNFPDLTNITENACNYPIIQAEAGGQILLTNVRLFMAGPQAFNADGTNSIINLRELTNCNGQSNFDVTFEASSGGEIVLTNVPSGQLLGFTFNAGGSIPISRLTNLYDGQITLAGETLSLPALQNIDASSLNVSAGGFLTVPNVGSYSGSTYIQPLWEASGAGSELSLPGLTNFVGNGDASAMQISAASGGEILLSSLQTIDNGNMAFVSDGAGSIINLTSLSGFVLQNGQGSLTAEDDGTILLNNQAFLLANVAINIPAGNPVLPPTLIASSTLTLYGQAWNSYLVEERNTLVPDSPFTFFEYVPLTNAFQPIAPAPPPNTAFLVTQFVANPPILDLSKITNHVQLVLYGLTNGVFEVQSATNLGHPTVWTNYTSVTMTNAFRIFPAITPSGTDQFYRAYQE